MPRKKSCGLVRPLADWRYYRMRRPFPDGNDLSLTTYEIPARITPLTDCLQLPVIRD